MDGASMDEGQHGDGERQPLGHRSVPKICAMIHPPLPLIFFLASTPSWRTDKYHIDGCVVNLGASSFDGRFFSRHTLSFFSSFCFPLSSSLQPPKSVFFPATHRSRLSPVCIAGAFWYLRSGFLAQRVFSLESSHIVTTWFLFDLIFLVEPFLPLNPLRHRVELCLNDFIPSSIFNESSTRHTWVAPSSLSSHCLISQPQSGLPSTCASISSSFTSTASCNSTNIRPTELRLASIPS
ncbi:hypothetical protein B0T14DRAFT_170284 [Immersiella caudata]|uniref:Uncharacterized protein n=1 Tax=Immersiella caudata TaxID=314043 RepID=A0AA39WX59_9PEZI|nr:hypothetical protein B0T14DRAFT_170284 [Immersiella caudata]